MTPPAATEPQAGHVEHPRIEVGQTVAGISADELIASHGSPLYVYDRRVLQRRAFLLREALPANVDIAFAVKANASPLVLQTWRDLGLGADVASGGELRAALRAGFDASDIVFTGPGKTDAELEAALRAGVGGLTIESLDELDVVIAMAADARPEQGLMLRLATSGDAEDTPIIGAAGALKFGLTDAEADEAVRRLRAADALRPGGPYRLRGLHAFGASNVRDAAELVAALVHLTQRAERLAAAHGLELELLDAGGGLGIPYRDDEAPLDIGQLGQGVTAEMATWASRPSLRGTRLLFEPGRWLSGPAGAYLCRVTRTKARDGRAIAITDGGIHHLLRPRLVGQDHRVIAVGSASERPATAAVDIVGPLCTGIDILASSVPGPQPVAGDLFAVLDAGAYGYSESMPLFLSHPIPAEVLVAADGVAVSRARIEPA